MDEVTARISRLPAEVVRRIQENLPAGVVLEAVRCCDVPTAQYAATIDFPSNDFEQLAAVIAEMVVVSLAKEPDARIARLGVAGFDGGAFMRLWLDRSLADQVSADGVTIRNPGARRATC